MIWKHKPTLEGLNGISENTLVDHIGIEFTEIGDDYLIAKMPVDQRTKQPMGLLHGGASVVLAETVGSIASSLLVEDYSKQTVVGVEINANHLRAVKSGFVYGKATPLKIGKRLHVWNIEISNEKGQISCTSRLTMMVNNINI